MMAGPPSSPQLVLETGFHTAMITRVDAAPDGTLLTVSDDKTARLWRLAGGMLRPERVLRVPRGPGDEGKLSAGAVSRDGQWVAVGGWTGGIGTGSASCTSSSAPAAGWPGGSARCRK